MYGTLLRLVRRPSLWPTALRQYRRTCRPRWWTRPPFLPVPDPAYVRFRLETAYGLDGDPAPDDVVRYLEWCRTAEAARAPRTPPVHFPRSGR